MPVPQYNSRLFNYMPEHKSIYVDVTDLGVNLYHRGLLTSEIGFIEIINTKTTGVMQWEFINTEFNNKKEPSAWNFQPRRCFLDEWPNMEGWVLTIYND